MIDAQQQDICVVVQGDEVGPIHHALGRNRIAGIAGEGENIRGLQPVDDFVAARWIVTATPG
jgi:hypothetical protein